MKARFSVYPVRYIGAGCLAVLALLIGDNQKAKTVAVSAAAYVVDFIDSTCAAVADGNFDEFREARTGNSFRGNLFTLGVPSVTGLPAGLGITQACQLKFSYEPPDRPYVPDPNVPVHLIASVRNNVTANTKVVRIPARPDLFGDVPKCSEKPENYGCPDPLASPCSCPGLFYRAQVAFISKAQSFGAITNENRTKSFVLPPEDVRELQELIDQYGADNIIIGGALTDPGNSSWGFKAERMGDATLNTTVSIAHLPGCIGPGSVVKVTVRVANPSNTSQTASLSSLPPPRLQALPGACFATFGACRVINGSTVVYSGAIPPNHTAIITYLARVADGAQPGVNLCISTTASIPGNCRTVRTCITTNCPPTQGCARSQGFWKTHPQAWPVTSLRLGNQIYSRAESLILLGRPVNGDASLILSRQLIAAKLNIANGANDAVIAATVAAADNWLSNFAGKLPYNVRTSTPRGRTAVHLANILERYNEGDLAGGPPSCN